MTARRLAELLMLAILLFVAFAPASLFGQSFPSDQLYLQFVSHDGAYLTDLTLTNLTSDRITIAIEFHKMNTPADPSSPVPRYFRTLDPGKNLTFESDQLGITSSGMFILTGWREHAPSVHVAADLAAPFDAMPYGVLRPFSASAHVYKSDQPPCGRNPQLPCTRGDTYVAEPWYEALVIPGQRVQLTGIRVDARFGTQIGIENASEFSAINVTAILRDGAGVERGRWMERLEPLAPIRRSAEQMFPALAANRLNRQPAIASPWIEFVPTGVIPVAWAKENAGCEDGCPAFLAHAAVMDSVSGDFSIHMATRDEPATAAAALRIAAKSSVRYPRITDLFHFTFSGPQCSIEPSKLLLGDYILRLPIGDGKYGPPATHFGVEKLVEAREMCGVGRIGDAQ